MAPGRLFSSLLNRPLRTKFVVSIVLVFLIGGSIILIFGTRLEHQTIISLAQAKVRHDLQSAWMVYNDTLHDIRDIVRMNAARDSLLSALSAGDRDFLKISLGRVRADFGLDVLTVTDDEGTVVMRASNPDTFGDDLSADPVTRSALEGATVFGTDIVPRDKLLSDGEALARRAYMALVATPKAAPSPEHYQDSGMMLRAAAPLRDTGGNLIGTIQGGILLNRNFSLVDRVKEIVFKGEKYDGVDIGTATIFQNDLRISTNVYTAEGRRAIGTRVSAEVSRAVIKEGKAWMDRAFVVNDWYISAYEPIRNLDRDIIGILYVGMLERPYLDLRNRVMGKFTATAVFFTLLLLAILFIIISSFIRPLKSLVFATDKIAEGDLSHRVEIRHKDEIGQLARSFNSMTENLKIANTKLVDWGKTLEKRVEERSTELQEVQNSLTQSEKLASMGKMAAGVAHEINNPLTSILINTHLMLEKISPEDPFYESLTLVADETSRCSSIVKGLLEFSRQNPPQIEPADLNDILLRTLKLLENQVVFHNIKIQKNLDDSIPMAFVDKSKIKQVFWNLLVNAAEAMRDSGGTLSISTRSKEPGNVEIVFCDTGAGIPREHINKLFDPFFTTKGGGTGLGLAVSYGIVKQHGGRILVESEPRRGTCMTVQLPLTHTTK